MSAYDREGEVRDLSVWKARGCLEDKEAGERVCTSLGQDPEGAMGWECLERLQEDRQAHRVISYFILQMNMFLCGLGTAMIVCAIVKCIHCGPQYMLHLQLLLYRYSSHQSCVAIRWCNIAKCIFYF